eukprot:15048870-Heterocapsa_arctica.AAC.1
MEATRDIVATPKPLFASLTLSYIFPLAKHMASGLEGGFLFHQSNSLAGEIYWENGDTLIRTRPLTGAFHRKTRRR